MNPLRGVQNLEPDGVPVLVIVQDQTRLLLVTLFDQRIAQEDPQHIYFGVIGDPHVRLQYLAILLVRYTVTIRGGSGRRARSPSTSRSYPRRSRVGIDT